MERIFALVLGAATPGGGFPVYGDAVQPRNTKGSTENVPLLGRNRHPRARQAGHAASHRRGDVLVARSGRRSRRQPASLHRRPRGRPVVLGTQASGVTALGRAVFTSLGIDVQPIYLEKAADGPPMLLDGRADALWGAGVGWPAFTALARTGARFLAPSQAETQAYPRQDTPLASVGSWSYVLAKPALPDEAAYLLKRETTMANSVAAAPRPDLLHPGVRRYLAEAGLR